jgi:Na+-translocating ferredoxin:NAD+ oxidoreductase RnfG subunit
MANGHDAEASEALMRALCEKMDTKIAKAIGKAVDAAPTYRDAQVVAVHAATMAVAGAIGVIAGLEGIDAEGAGNGLHSRVADLIFGELGLDEAEGTVQ